ncbi:MAG TPA: hypothetical protein VEX13_11665 [Chloroflexia bacterium]|nr:hypothetical protein [Chloroflexia bacterium]
MAALVPMPPIIISQTELAQFGQVWINNGQRLSRTPPRSSGELGRLFDTAVGNALATMLGGILVLVPNAHALTPPHPDCVEVGPVRVIGGVRPQNFDVGYRPDGVRFAFDSKTLNDRESIGKNWQNMINDLATEATTVHSRFPHALVAFMVVYPEPCVSLAHRRATIDTLERLARRISVEDPDYMAEAISLVLWDPYSGMIDPAVPDPASPLRIEKFSAQVQDIYVSRYKGLPPHAE